MVLDLDFLLQVEELYCELNYRVIIHNKRYLLEMKSKWQKSMCFISKISLFIQYKKHSIRLAGWDCRIHRLHHSRSVRPSHNEGPGYDTKQSDCEVPIMLELWGIRSTPSLPSPQGPLWPRLVAQDRVLSVGQIELKPHTNAKLNCLN